MHKNTKRKGVTSMELKVFKDTLAAYGGRWETRQELPVETEILIPDYQPAVFKIVKCLMQPVVLQNRVASGRWHCEGYLRCTVYYQSDEPGCRLYRTEQKFAFEKSVELPDAAFAEGPAQVWGEQEYCNCRAVSEHRIDLRGAYILCAAALMVRNCELLTSLADCGIEQRTQELSGLTRVAAEEKALTSEINLPLPGTGESILDIGGSFTLTSLTMQTGQASCQGILQVQVCCQPPESEALDVRTKEMTVQQTVDLPGAAESDQCIAWGELLHCTLRTEDGAADASLSVTWKLHLELWRLAAHTVQERADTMNTVLDWPDRVLVLSQGDDATRWYYYRYELTAQVVNGFGGFYGRLGETQDRWDSDFMNLVESENWTLYDYKAVCVPATLVAYMQEKDCDYLLIDRADDYLQREFSPYFEGGLTADMPATLYHFEGADAAVPFTLAAVAESGVE